MIIDLNVIQKLLDDESITAYKIAKDTGLSRPTITKLRNDPSTIKTANAQTLITLQEYQRTRE